jgi:hypothetical protein
MAKSSTTKTISKSIIISLFVAGSICSMVLTGCTTGTLSSTKYVRAIVDGTVYQWPYLATNYSWTQDPSVCTRIYTGPLAKYYLSTSRREIFAHEAVDQSKDIARLTMQVGDSTIDRGCTVDTIELQSSQLGLRFIGSNLVYGTGFTENKPDQTCTASTYSLSIPYKQQTLDKYTWDKGTKNWVSSGTATLTHLDIITEWYGGL